MAGLCPAIFVGSGAPVRLRRAGIGDIDGFINAYLTASANGTLKK